ncbi:MAG: glutamyl-tRNA reductase [Candidatus Margulisbacteria bacterium]|nr:glutamyl-tRNA reductase [Candidatus Margulisiibacteriota bacterium]
MITLKSRGVEFSLAEREAYLQTLRPDSASHVALFTCDRVELYEGSGPAPWPVARHLFRVASGLESALLGETAIQGQVKKAYLAARQRPLAPELHRLFQRALHAGKRVRAETGLSRGAVSHGQAVPEILARLNIDLAQSRILIIGVNNLNHTVLRYLARNGAGAVFVANRTYERAQELAREFDCRALRLDSLPELLPQVDIMISATSAPHLIIPQEKFTARQPLIIFDLAVPRDIASAIGALPNVTLYNNEDIEKIIAGNQRSRSSQIAAAERIIQEELAKLYA